MKMFKDGQESLVDKSQMYLMLESGWTMTKDEVSPVLSEEKEEEEIKEEVVEEKVVAPKKRASRKKTSKKTTPKKITPKKG